MLLHTRPHALIRLDFDLLTRVEFIQSPQIHLAVQQRDHVFVEGLPVRVFEVVSNVAVSIALSSIREDDA